MEEINTDQHFLDELKRGAPAAFEELYRKYYRMAESLVVRLHGQPDEAQDVFQETLFVLVKKLREPDFRLTSKLSTFLYAIVRNVFLKKTGKTAPEVQFSPEDFATFRLPEPATDGFSPTEKEALLTTINEKLDALEEGCRSLLLYTFYQNLPHADIARLTGYSEAFVRVKKFRCLEYLRRMVITTGTFKDL